MPPATPILDNFNRADEGPPPSASWVNALGGLKVSGNVCIADTAGGSHAASWNTLFPANQEAFFSIATAKPADNTATRVYARLVTATDVNSDRYFIHVISIVAANDQLRIQKRIANVTTTLGAQIDIGGEHAVGDQVWIRVEVSTITCFRNGVSQGVRTDTDLSGAGFIGLNYNGNANSDFDDFGGGPTPGIIASAQHRPALRSSRW